MSSDCPQLVSVSLFVDDELSDGERRSLLEHFRVCATCSKELQDLTNLRAILTNARPDPSVSQRVFGALPLRESTGLSARRHLSVPLPIAAGILLVLGISIGSNVYLAIQQRGQGQGVSKNSALESRNPQLLPAAPVETKTSTGIMRPLPTTSAQARLSSPSGKPCQSGAGPAKTAARTFVITLQSDQGITQFVTDIQYQPNPVPKIYTGGFFNPSEER